MHRRQCDEDSGIRAIALAGNGGSGGRCLQGESDPEVVGAHSAPGTRADDHLGQRPNDVFAVGSHGTILHYPGRLLRDINGDGAVDVSDLLAMARNWGT